MGDISFEKLAQVIEEFKNSGSAPTVSVGSKAMFQNFASRLFSEEVRQFDPVLFGKNSDLPMSMFGLRIEHDDCLPAFAMVIEDLRELRVFDMRTGKGMAALKDKLPFPIKTPEDRAATVYIMLNLSAKGDNP